MPFDVLLGPCLNSAMKQKVLKFCRFALVSTIFSVLPAQTAFALDGWYLGGQVGHIGLTSGGSSAYSNTIGFGLDLGVRTNAVLDLNLALQLSSHSGGSGLTLISQAVSADLRLADVNDFEFFAGGGPGFYFLKPSGVTNSKFGLNFGLLGNVKIDENIRLGLNWKYHLLFDNQGFGNYYTITMRFGYFFDLLGGA